MASDFLVIKGARENNLKNIDLTLPKDKLIVFTGVSGSGKSTLAFDTIYAEGQRRYLESLSSYARQFLGGNEKPDVDSIDGMSPTISIDQKTTSHNPRSTVGTVTEIYDYLRLLYSRIGVPYCPKHNIKIVKFTPKKIIDIIFSNHPSGEKIVILAPLVKNEKGTHKDTIDKFFSKGYIRFKVDGNIYRYEDIPPLEKNKKHFIDIVVDRIILSEEKKTRIAQSIETALDCSSGYVVIQDEKGQENLYSDLASCPECGFSVPPLEPRLFSFNNPLGACPECGGLGVKSNVVEELLIPDPTLTINQGAILPFKNEAKKDKDNYDWQQFKYICAYFNIPLDIPYKDLDEKQKKIILRGIDFDLEVPIKQNNGHVLYKKGFEGLATKIERLYEQTTSQMMRKYYRSFHKDQICPKCNGARLNDKVLSVKVGGLNIYELCSLSLSKCLEFFASLSLSEEEEQIANLVLKEIKNRLTFLINVGLDYLTLARIATTLSGGEAQRIRLATQIGSKLTGVIYVLDEPSIGLHQKDNDRLIESLKAMRDLGNTLIVVEHDEDTMLNSDYLVDIGPRAGVHGGEVVASGTVEEVMANENSITGQYLSGKKFIPVPFVRNNGNGRWLKVFGARCNNLKNINVSIPLGTFTCITGVSGSGKSSLVTEIIYKYLYNHFYKGKLDVGEVDRIEGYNYIDKVINISQDPIGKTSRSNPATYIGVFDDIRELFAQTVESRSRGYDKGRFSFNVKGGRCEACEGDGVKRISMAFFPDVYVQCEECRGKRYNDETLEVYYKGKNIYDVLEMTVEESVDFFRNIPSIYQKLKTLQDVGLSYIKLGQSSDTLSGGEAQRVKLASELSRRDTGNTLYILDEPTTGLHVDDVRCLLQVLKSFVEHGNTVLVIEHNLDLIKCADYIIDLGPEGGDRGGTLIAYGTPEEVSKKETSYTGQFLKRILKRDKDRMLAK